MPPNDPQAVIESTDNKEFFYQLAYCSVLTQQLDAAAVQEIVDYAQQSNVANNVTGMLMIEQGLVIQWLEGKKSDVRRLWAKLQEDTRHHCLVELLHRDFADERLFPNWSMQRTTREEMLTIVHGAREQAEAGEPSPWAGAIATMCLLIDPEYAKRYETALHNSAAVATHRAAAFAHSAQSAVTSSATPLSPSTAGAG